MDEPYRQRGGLAPAAVTRVAGRVENVTPPPTRVLLFVPRASLAGTREYILDLTSRDPCAKMLRNKCSINGKSPQSRGKHG